MHRRIAVLLCLCITVPASLGSQPAPSIRGFTAAHAAAERERETQFQAVPSPAELRENMRAISAEPHHAVSARGRKVAEYILAKFTASGLKA